MLFMPYFMENTEWFYFDSKEFKYKLTDKATNKAKKSYEEFYKYINDRSERGQKHGSTRS